MITGPHDHLADTMLAKAQGMVSHDSKLCVGSCFPDKGIHAFLLQHSYENVCQFITINKLTYLDRDLITRYIAGGFRDPRELADFKPSQPLNQRNVGSGPAGTHETTPTPPRKFTRIKESLERVGRGRGGKRDGSGRDAGSQEIKEGV